MRRIGLTGCLLTAVLWLWADNLPRSVDNSLSVHFPPVFTQIGGSCAQASAVGYMFTYEMNLLLDRDASVGENRFSYLYTWNFLNGGVDEGSFSWDGLLLSMHCGMMSEADFPAQSSARRFYWASGYDRYERALHYRLSSLHHIDVESPTGVDSLRTWLYNGGQGHVVTFSSGARDWGFDYAYDGPSQTGYHCLLTRLPSDGPHQMTIAGYDDEVECVVEGDTCRGAFIVVNSYGDDYHDRGRYYLPYRFFEQATPAGKLLSHQVMGIVVTYVEPRLVFRVGLDYTSRNDLKFLVGVGNKPFSEAPSASQDIHFANFQGGDWPMQGSGRPSYIEMAFDASFLLDKAEAMDQPKYFLEVVRNCRGEGGSGRLTAFQVVDYVHGKTYTCTESFEPLQWGSNLYGIATTPQAVTSACPVDWINAQGNPVNKPFLLRTASGRYVKLNFTRLDNESLRLDYHLAAPGSTNLGQ